MTQKKAGHLLGAKIVEAQDCCIIYGRLVRDTRGTHHTGESRDFSGANIHTSWLERLEYVEKADTTVIYTRNSIYFAAGNILEEVFGEGTTFAEGKAEMKEMFVANLAKQRPEVEDNVVYELTEDGVDMTGEKLGAPISTAPSFNEHDLCAPNEVPFSLLEHDGTTDLQQVFFLKAGEFKRASRPLLGENA